MVSEEERPVVDRQEGEKAFLRGDLATALTLQRDIVATADAEESLIPRDLQVLGFLLNASGQVEEAVRVFRRGVMLFPQEPSLPENLGVVLAAMNDNAGAVDAYHRALGLGSDSVNVLDGLCCALGNLGQTAEALQHGRRALEAKDRRFGRPVSPLPSTAPPAFNPRKPAENVIAYCVWGDHPRYLAPLLENVRIARHLFPTWTLRVYADETVPQTVRNQLAGGGAQVRLKQVAAKELPFRKLLWRFEVIADPDVKRFLIRDADSLLTVKERCAVDDWLRSDKYFHVMRDFYTHTDLMLAGLWGGVGGILPGPDVLLRDFEPWRLENSHIDQDLLTATVWPIARQSCLIHDSVFTGCLGSIPFPPYGELPAGHHVGQNAFMHFRPG